GELLFFLGVKESRFVDLAQVRFQRGLDGGASEPARSCHGESSSAIKSSSRLRVAYRNYRSSAKTWHSGPSLTEQMFMQSRKNGTVAWGTGCFFRNRVSSRIAVRLD